MGVEWKARSRSVRAGSAGVEESLGELAELAAGAGAEVTERITQARATPEAATLIGHGKVQELAAAVNAGRIDVVNLRLFDGTGETRPGRATP